MQTGSPNLRRHVLDDWFMWRIHNNFYKVYLTSEDPLQLCVYSFLCHAVQRQTILDVCHLTLASSTQSVPNFIILVSPVFLTTPWHPWISVLVETFPSCQLILRIHDDCSCHRNDSSIIKVAAWDHKYSKESQEGGKQYSKQEIDRPWK